MFQTIKDFFTPHKHEATLQQDGVLYSFTRTGIKNIWRGGIFESTVVQYDGYWTKYTGWQESCLCGHELTFKYEKEEEVTDPKLLRVLQSGRSWNQKVLNGPKRVKNVLDATEALKVMNRIEGRNRWKIAA